MVMQRTRSFAIRRVSPDDAGPTDDLVAIEEPLEIRLGFRDGEERREKSISITMRTPGNDDELAVGFLYTEGIVHSREDVIDVWYRSPPVPGETDLRNVVRVDLADTAGVDFERLQRHFYTTSSCGVCGKASLEALDIQSHHGEAIAESAFVIAADQLVALTGKLMDRQEVFGETGGLHAAGLFDAAGDIALVREDVGRHNAMDKLVGRLFLDKQLPAAQSGVLLSGRASFELVQKAAMAGVPLVAAVGAPSSLAIDLARQFDITLVGFLRDGRLNIYSGEQRVT